MSRNPQETSPATTTPAEKAPSGSARMTATATRAGDGLRHVVDVNGRHTIETDEPLGLGGTDRGPAPHELLPATLASCVATMVAMYAQRHDWDLEGMRVDVTYDPEAQPRSLEVDLHLPGALSPEQRQRLERVARNCPVRRALEAGFRFEERTVHDEVPEAA